jgi:hypothetical protein
MTGLPLARADLQAVAKSECQRTKPGTTSELAK